MKKFLAVITIVLALVVPAAVFTACGDDSKSSNDGSVTVLASVSDVYKEITGHDFPMAGLFVRGDVLENEPALVAKIDARVETSVENFNSDIDTVATKADNIEGFSLTAGVIKQAYTKMNVRYKDSADSKGDVTTLLTNIEAAVSDDLFADVSGSAASAGTDYTLYAPDGAPVLALADMWGEDFTYGTDGSADITYAVTAESNVSALMTSGEADFIVAPINVGAQIHAGYKAGNMQYDYKLVNVTSWGVIYFTTNTDEYESRSEFADTVDGAKEFLSQFDGKTISTIGLAAIPGKTVQYLFEQADADVTVNGSDASTIQQSYIAKDPMTAIFAEPAITATNIRLTSGS